MKPQDIQEAAKRAMGSGKKDEMPQGDGKHIDIHLRICLPTVDDELDADTPEDSSGEYQMPTEEGKAPTKQPKGEQPEDETKEDK